MELLKMTNITKSFSGVEVLSHVDFSVERGEVHALLGENGAGKSTLMNILAGVHQRDEGEIEFDGEQMHDISVKRTEQAGIAFVHQELNLFNDLKVYENIFLRKELLTKLGTLDKRAMLEQTRQLMSDLGVDIDPNALVDELETSKKQLLEIAKALHANAKLFILDEPTTALDVTIQAQILELMNDLRHKLGMSIIMITHDLGVVAQMCEKIAVMYAGHIVEYGTTDEILYNPQHEYTKGLINSIPKLNTAEHERLVPIEGTPVDLLNPPAGCPFAPRCKNCMKICLSKMPPRTELSDTHYTYCWLQQKAAFEKGEKAE